MSKLNLGCGKCYIPGWVNLDLFSNNKADIYADVTALPFEREEFDLIYASHILEHIHRHKIVATLTHWKDLLKHGGTLRLAVPNFGAVVERYQEERDIEEIMGLLYGGQNHPLNSHTVAFDARYLIKLLKQSGLTHARYWDTTRTEHADFDDYSKAYLPHMDFKNGKLMSLNIEADRP
jgi:predicted SAM-dependent methyltransferase